MTDSWSRTKAVTSYGPTSIFPPNIKPAYQGTDRKSVYFAHVPLTISISTYKLILLKLYLVFKKKWSFGVERFRTAALVLCLVRENTATKIVFRR